MQLFLHIRSIPFSSAEDEERLSRMECREVKLAGICLIGNVVESAHEQLKPGLPTFAGQQMPPFSPKMYILDRNAIRRKPSLSANKNLNNSKYWFKLSDFSYL